VQDIDGRITGILQDNGIQWKIEVAGIGAINELDGRYGGVPRRGIKVVLKQPQMNAVTTVAQMVKKQLSTA
jgi:hypothetical protein